MASKITLRLFPVGDDYPPGSVVCTECGRFLPTERGFLLHAIRRHLDGAKVSFRRKREGTNICQLCGGPCYGNYACSTCIGRDNGKGKG